MQNIECPRAHATMVVREWSSASEHMIHGLYNYRVSVLFFQCSPRADQCRWMGDWMERIEKLRSDQPVKPPVSGSTQPPFDDDTGVHPFDGPMRASELIGQQNCSVRVDSWWIATMSWLVSHWINIWSNSNKHTHTHTLAKYPRASKHSTRAQRPETIVTNRHVEWARASPSAGRYHPMGSGWRCGGGNGGWMDG